MLKQKPRGQQPVLFGKKRRANKKQQKTAQQSIPYEFLCEDGIASLGNNEYSATFRISDINYNKIAEAMRISIFEKYCMFLNALTDDIRVQVHILTKQIGRNVERLRLPFPDFSFRTGSPYEKSITDYNDILERRVNGENSFTQEKYITVTVTGQDEKEAQRKISRIGSDALGILSSINCTSVMLNKSQRLMLLKEIYRPDDDIEITPEMFVKTGMSDRDLVAPYGIEFPSNDESMVKLGDYYTNVLFLTDFPDELPDNIIQEITSINENILLTSNVLPQNVKKALQDVKKRLRMLDKEESDSFARQTKASLAIPRTPRDLKKAMDNMETFLQDLQSRNEKMFLNNVLILVRSKDKEKLKTIQGKVEEKVLKSGCSVHQLKFDVENGLNSMLPLGRNDTFIKRTFTTTSTAVFIPFNVVEILNPNGLLYGVNSQSHNLLVMNRKTLDNPHGFFFGSSGSGKSMGAKMEVYECFHRTKDSMLIIDPDGDFHKTMKLICGTELIFSNGTSMRFNPMDINKNYGGEDEPNPIRFKSDYIISLMQVILGEKREIDPISRSVIDRCVREVYRRWEQIPIESNIPTLPDFYDALSRQPEEEAQYLHSALEIYVTGSLNIFAERTNVNLDSRVISFNTQRLGKQLKPIAMSIIQDFCWNQITKNQRKDKHTWLWNDEIHTSLRNTETAAWLIDSWKRGRKYGLIATGMTQEIHDVLKSEDARSLVANSEFIMLYHHSEAMAEDIAKVVALSEGQISMLRMCEQGTGLFKAGNNVVEFDNRIPKDTTLFETFMTDVKGEKKKEGSGDAG